MSARCPVRLNECKLKHFFNRQLHTTLVGVWSWEPNGNSPTACAGKSRIPCNWPLHDRACSVILNCAKWVIKAVTPLSPFLHCIRKILSFKSTVNWKYWFKPILVLFYFKPTKGKKANPVRRARVEQNLERGRLVTSSPYQWLVNLDHMTVNPAIFQNGGRRRKTEQC